MMAVCLPSEALASAILCRSVPVLPWVISGDFGVMLEGRTLWVDDCLRRIGA